MTNIIPVLKGGLGNQLFIIASAFAFAKEKDMNMKISGLHIEFQNVHKHSQLNYFTSIFQYIDQSEDDKDAIILNDYFQDYRNFDMFYNDIQSLFWLPSISNFYKNDLSNVCFIHYRKTDFLDIGIHHVLDSNTQYYENCIQHALLLFPECKFLIFSDDIDLALDHHHNIFELFSKESFSIASKNLNELETLAIMRSCGLGGIAANSTFSWWGLYLNKNRPIMMIPNIFFNEIEMNHDGYYFPGCIVKYI